MNKKLTKLTEMLQNRFDLNIEMDDIQHLNEVRKHYQDKQKIMMHESGEYQTLKNPDYAKAFLIIEAINIFLREIAPKRRKRKNK